MAGQGPARRTTSDRFGGKRNQSGADDPDEHGDTREFEVPGVVVGPITYWPDNPQATASNMLIVSVANLDETA